MDSQSKDWIVLVNSTKSQDDKNVRLKSLIPSIGSLIFMIVVSVLFWWQIQELVNKLPSNVKRDEWGAPPLTKVKKLELPINRVIITTTGGAECRTRSECIDCVRALELLEFDSQIFNFFVGGDGWLYEGYGFNQKAEKGCCDNSIGIALIGAFLDSPPPKKQLEALKLILKTGVRDGKLSPNYKIYPQKELVASSESFEKYIVSVIREWPHFVG